MRTYEAMVLVDPTVAARELNRIQEEVDRILKKNGGQLIQFSKWGERKLAFPIRKAKRGTYALVYFALPEKAIGKLRADFGLSELIYRSIVVNLHGMMRKDPPKDFEIAGTIAAKRAESSFGGGDDRPRF